MLKQTEIKEQICTMLWSLISIYTIRNGNHSHKKHFNPFPKPQILDYSKLKEFADDNFKFSWKLQKFF